MAKVGITLGNGATVVAAKKIGSEPNLPDEYVILCVRDSVEPYVTWLAYWNGAAGTYTDTVWGHYTRDFDTAVQDFRDRVGNYAERT